MTKEEKFNNWALIIVLIISIILFLRQVKQDIKNGKFKKDTTPETVNTIIL